ncbi:unnamed protein product [Ranitomeya imitator]|uniref:Tf2-1-like SH3-like domain-containing protein n=1 Tax=Ranitomeya imitator TaxID=111125 RepID=A0ABN9LLI6_9NEOB|nr:unnamed protein product [Ranitomeya imitator]
MRSSADAHQRSALTFAPGDLVWLSARNIRLRVESTKFAPPRYLGPFKVLEQVNPMVYGLALPPRLGITDTFHVSLLKPVYMSWFSESSAGTSGSSSDDYTGQQHFWCQRYFIEFRCKCKDSISIRNENGSILTWNLQEGLSLIVKMCLYLCLPCYLTFPHLMMMKYEVMQFCWLQPEQRPSVEEVHLLLSYLSVKGADELEEEFEKRWNAMKPNGGADSGAHHESELSSYPLLEHFSSDGFHSDGDDVLTVTQTSQGLNFEYKWERGRHDQYPLSPGCQQYQDMYYTTGTGDRISLGVSPSGYENKDCTSDSRPLELVPVVSARSPSVAGDYYIRIEEHLGNVHQEDIPQHEQHSPKDKEELSADEEQSEHSPAISLSMEPLLIHVGSSTEETCWVDQAKNRNSCSPCGGEAEEHPVAENNRCEGFVDPLGPSPSFNPTCHGEEVPLSNVSESEDIGQICRFDSVTIEAEDGLDISERTSQLPAFSPHWASNISSNNNISSEPQPHSPGVWCNHRSEDTQENESLPPYGPETWQAMETGEGDNNMSIAEGLQEDFYKAEEHMTQELSETQVPPGQCSPTQAKTTVPHPDHIPHPLESPHSPDVDSSQEMDPLGVGLIINCEVLESSCNLQTTEKDNVSIAVSQEVSLSPDKEIKDPEEKSVHKDFYQMHSDSEDEDTMELTSGVYTDLSSERGDMAHPILQKQVGTPDSLDSLDMPSTASSCEAFGLATYAPCAQHKALDSGYDTENYESPEFVLKEPQDNRESEVYYQLSQSQEHSLEPGDMPMSRSVSSDLQGLDAKNPYRDSAYFSDYDSFNREEEEEGDQGDERELQEASESLLCTKLDVETTVSDLGENVEDLNVDHSPSTTKVEEAFPEITVSSLPSTSPKEVSLLAPPLIVREESVDEGLGLDSSTEKQPNISSSVEPTPSHRTFTLSPVQLCLTKTCMVKPGATGSITLTTGLQADDKSGNREVLGACHLPKCLSPPLIRKEGKVGDSTEEDDEDEESDDSDESDEELRCYNIQEHSEESEEEHTTVPIVITDNESCGHLRSLLKVPPGFLPQAETTELDRKKKAVSFFDDVTVYLFDQESPTLELPDQEIPELPSVLQEMTFKEPTNHLLAGGEFEWDEALPIKPVKSSFITSLTPVVLNTEVDSTPDPIPTPTLVPTPMPIQKPQLPVQFSRFSVSPTAVSRFSITQVADNAVGSLEDKIKTGDQV